MEITKVTKSDVDKLNHNLIEINRTLKDMARSLNNVTKALDRLKPKSGGVDELPDL